MKRKSLSFALLALLGASVTSSAQSWMNKPPATLMTEIRLSATTCPGGGNKAFVIGHRPDIKECIDIDYDANCPTRYGSSYPISGTIKNFVGGASCYGDSHEIKNASKLDCEPEKMRVWVTAVRYCE
ncbi:exported hypothetical protein [uncultured Stenotrophomonas sp.]|uniref:Secreted protein n=1 Tax=uncultured Stenotrophomonas sp. TaxID=165438 RepID=A0A1Y5Q520_9GAMM|nr:exported hypothetical protein [uncultured Stenotrophomonas sp.]